MTLEVIEPGLFSTIQDRGRPGWVRLGVPPGGACDPWSLAVANHLAGNDPEAAAIEMTLIGPTFAVRAATTIGLAGADLGGVVRETGQPLEAGRSHSLDAGSTIDFPGAAAGSTGTPGCRAYLAVRGGFEIPLTLGSASTLVSAGFGGVDGRPLREGDVLRARGLVGGPAPAQAWPSLAGDPLADGEPDRPLRVVPGPGQSGDGAGNPGFAALLGDPWRVGSGSDRVGLRLDGRRIAAAEDGDLLSHGVVLGAIQVPPDGSPIVLMADHQTTGGYPIAAVVISADHPRLGQLRPGAGVRFEAVSFENAREALRAQRAALVHGAAILRDDAGWDALWQSAGS
jgi:biotin-dependent carboxylase-like uncharacterized protein